MYDPASHPLRLCRLGGCIGCETDAYQREQGNPVTTVNTVWLQFTTSQAARFALGYGVERATVVATLRSLADAIEDPTTVAENMSPILPDEF